MHAGPYRADAWGEALGAVPPGPVLIGPALARRGPVRGAYRAAAAAARRRRAARLPARSRARGPARGARRRGRRCSAPGGPDATPPPSRALSVAAGRWPPVGRALSPPAGLDGRGRGDSRRSPKRPAREAPRRSAPLAPHDDGESRRAIVEARAGVEPEAAEALLRGDPPRRLARRMASDGSRRPGPRARRRASRVLPPRPVGARRAGGQRGGRGAPRGAGGARRSGRASRRAPPRGRALDRRVGAGPRGRRARGKLPEGLPVRRRDRGGPPRRPLPAAR